MATIAKLGTEVINTTGGTSTTQTSTPAVNDLIAVVVFASAAANKVASVTDNNSSGTYTKVGEVDLSTTHTVGIFVRDALIASASSTIFTANYTGTATGGGLCPFSISGMSKTGATAIRQSNTATGLAGTTPTVVLGAAALTSNPLLGAGGRVSNPPAWTARSSPAYTEAFDVGYNSPSSGVEAMFISSGETASSIAWGATTPGDWHAIVAEFDSSAAATPSLIWQASPLPIQLPY